VRVRTGHAASRRDVVCGHHALVPPPLTPGLEFGNVAVVLRAAIRRSENRRSI
jgi:hypothetical protein